MRLRMRGSQRASQIAWRVAGVAIPLLLMVAPARSVILANGDGSGNTTAPIDDPGFANILDPGLSAVYLGNGWAITAEHAPLAGLRIDGVFHRAIEGSKRRLRNRRSFFRPDLALWKLYPTPDLPPVRIRETPPEVGAPVVLIGHGRDRGEPTKWNDIEGFATRKPRSIRWGTNRVHESELDVRVRKTDLTRGFSTTFSPPTADDATEHECQVSNGDSGGAAFIRGANGWELAGVLFARSGHPEQPQDLALYGNVALIADLSYYRDEILALTSAPACSDGLDDDGDGLVDYPDDADCESAEDDTEAPG